MTYPVARLVNESFNMSGVVGAGFQSVNGDSRAQQGLQLLNDIIVEKSMDAVFIPYDTHEQVPMVAGQEIYFIPKLVKLNTLTYNLTTGPNSLRFPLFRDNINQYFATGRANGIQSLPTQYFAERTLDGMKLYFYFVPNSNYVLNIDGRYSYDEVAYNTDLLIQFDRFQIVYFKYKLTSRICDFYNVPMSEESKQQLDNMERRFNNLSGEDMSIVKGTFSSSQSSYNYAWAPLYKGFIPG